ncbi:MAG TPA: CpaF family protein [Actinomycetota bacterium]|nr:CpaF family protein [Actinomycetota bacterium]
MSRTNGKTAGRREALVREVGARLAATKRGVTLEGVEAALRDVLASQGVGWRPEVAQQAVAAITDELAGFGAIGPLLRDTSVSEVMVNASGAVFVERDGRIEPADVRFGAEAEVRHLIERVVSPLGLRIDATSPWVDARLADGSRFHAVLPPIALGGPVVTIRKFADVLWTIEDLIAMGSLDRASAVRLVDAVRGRENVLVSGGGGCGKTTLLGVLARLVGASERIVTIEDAAELRLGERHVVGLETRPANVEGRGEVTLRDLVRCAMRMRADRIIVGEVRGAEALDMLQALTSGHTGSMATVHADAPEEALMRLEIMALMAAPGLSMAAARRLIASAIDVVVHLARDGTGGRRVQRIAEVRVGTDGPVLQAFAT